MNFIYLQTKLYRKMESCAFLEGNDFQSGVYFRLCMLSNVYNLWLPVA